MDISRKQHGQKSCVIQLTAAIMMMILASPAWAEQTLTIGNDRGGSLRDRIYQIQEIRRTGQPVRVTGRICYSTCTMFLGLPQTCISPNTVFGFHGPSSHGRSLEPDVFDRASELIVAHYPEPLRDWYWNTARHSVHRLYRIKGTDMIRLGVSPCPQSD